MSELPYMKLWHNDYHSDTELLTIEQSGAYLHLLMAMWRNGGSLPNDTKQLARICRVSQVRWQRVIAPALDQYFTLVRLADGDVIQNKRLSLELQKARKERAQKQRGGFAKALKYKKPAPAAAPAEPGATHSHSHSVCLQEEQDSNGQWLREDELEREVDALIDSGVIP